MTAYAFNSEYAMEMGFTALSSNVQSVEQAKQRYQGFWIRVVHWKAEGSPVLFEGKV